MVRIIVELLCLLLVLFVAATAALYLLQERMIFFPQPANPVNQKRFAAHAIRLQHDGIVLSGWFFNRGATVVRPLIIYYGGNAEDVSLNFSDLGRFSTDAFLFMEYRGYGGSGGRPSEAALVDDALFVFDHLVHHHGVDPTRIVLMGRSLGSGVAVQVAARRKVAGLILVTPFDSLVNVARAHYPIFPVGWLLRHRFDSISLAGNIHTPALVLSAADDRVVPVRLAANLARQWSGPVTAVTVDGTDHNTIESESAYWEAINGFLRSLGSPTDSPACLRKTHGN